MNTPPEFHIREWRGWTIHECAAADSTNNHARQLPPWNAIRADVQTSGRGRHGRKWESGAGGLIAAKIINVFDRKNPINPLIGSAGVSAVPMAARVSQVEGQRADPGNHLLMHAMGPNVAGVIGTAVIAGYYIATLTR